MAVQKFKFALDQFTSFGDLLKYLRRRVGLTQRELAIAVGYSHAQISRLEANQRVPDMTVVAARFLPVLELEDEPEVAARLVDLAGSASRYITPASGLAPYKGLQAFEEQDSGLFFGRERLVEQLVDRMRQPLDPAEPRFLAVLGASGSGKSSLLHAGLVPTLRRTSRFHRWSVACITPGHHPLAALAACLPQALTADAGRQALPNLLLVIDRLEELFTLCADESERKDFVDGLMAASSQPDGSVYTIVALRADFYGRCAPYPALRDALALRQAYIGPMSTEDLRRAIEEPSRRNDWELEPGLIEVLLRDVGAEGGRAAEPGSLPLLSHALLETWHRRSGRSLTVSGYLASGGVEGAIAETADEVFYDGLDPAQQEISRAIFLRLVQIGEVGSADTRRSATFAELPSRPGDEPALQTVLSRLAAARLITIDQGVVELAHEALIRAWPTLRAWLDADRESLRFHRYLNLAVEGWERQGCDPGELYRGARLAQALSWAAEHAGELTRAERDFLAQSEAQARNEEAEREAQRTRELESARALAESQRQAAAQLRKRALFLTGAVVIALLMAAAALSLGEIARRSAVMAQSQERIASARELAAAALSNLEIDPERSILLALQAVSTTRTVDGSVLPEAQEALHRALLSSHVRLTLTGHEHHVVSAVFSRDGKRLATIGQDGTAIVWDTTTGKELVRVPGTTMPWDDYGYQMLDMSHDGQQLVTADRNLVKVWDAGTGALLKALEGHSADVRVVRFSPDGKLIASGSLDPLVHIWDVSTGKALFTLPDNPESVQNMAFSPDGNQLAYGTGQTVKIWDTHTGTLLKARDFTDPVDSVAYSPDGAALAVSINTAIEVWDAGLSNERPFVTIRDNVTNVTYSSDGTRLAAGSGSAAKVWDASTGRELLTLPGHTGWVVAVAFSPDGRSLATTSFDETARIWNITPGGEEALVADAGTRIAYSPDGKWLLTDAPGGLAKLWNAATGVEVRTFAKHDGPVTGVAFSPDGTRVATASFDRTAKIWDATSGQLLTTLTGHDVAVRDVAFSPDGKHLATAGFDRTARIWNAATGQEQLKLSGHEGIVIGVAFSPDGTRLATSSSDRTARVWDAATGQELLILKGHTAPIPDIAYSPDGSRLVSGAQDGNAIVWDAHTGKQLLTLTGHSSEIQSVAFSADGGTIATGSGDNTTILWDAATGEALMTLPGSLGGVTGVAFDPRNPQHLAVASPDGIARVLLLDVGDQVALARSRVTRRLTQWECRRFLHVPACALAGG